MMVWRVYYDFLENFLILLTYLFTPWSRVLLEKLIGFQIVKKSPALYGTRRFIATLTSSLHLSLSWARSTQSMPPHPTSWRPILILSSHLRLGIPSGLFPSGFPTKNLCPIRDTCSAQLIILDLITRIMFGEQCRSLSSSLCSFLHSPATTPKFVPGSSRPLQYYQPWTHRMTNLKCTL